VTGFALFSSKDPRVFIIYSPSFKGIFGTPFPTTRIQKYKFGIAGVVIYETTESKSGLSSGNIGSGLSYGK